MEHNEAYIPNRLDWTQTKFLGTCQFGWQIFQSEFGQGRYMEHNEAYILNIAPPCLEWYEKYLEVHLNIG